MTSFDPQQIADWTGGSWVNEPLADIEGFCFDARTIQPGQCFVALRGGTRDGHEFIQQASEGGAVAALVEQPQPMQLPQLQVEDTLRALGAIGLAVRSQFAQPVVGITGSCGKTSTKEMLKLLLGGEQCHATSGNWNNRIGVPMTLFGLDESVQDFAVIEAGINQPEEMQFLGEMIAADITMITNIGPAHLELLGSLENIAAEKSQLAKNANPGSPIVLPSEVLRYSAFAELADRAVVLSEADGERAEMGTPSSCSASENLQPLQTLEYEIRPSGDGRSQELLLEGESYIISSTSRGIALNAALAITTALRLGVSCDLVRERIEVWRPGSDRGQMLTHGNQVFYVDCYNANPASMKDALHAFGQAIPEASPRLYVLGAMNELGDFAEAEHSRIGEALDIRAVDQLCLVGPDSMTAAYLKGAQSAGVSEERVARSENVESFKSIVANFEGAIFLKGSRGYQLEKLLPITTE